MLPEHNKFSEDDYISRTERLQALSSNVAANAAAIELPAALVTWATGAGAAWIALDTTRGVEIDEAIAATTAFNTAFADVREYYIEMRNLLGEQLEDNEAPKAIFNRYDLPNATPRKWGDFAAQVRKFLSVNTELLAINDDYALDAALLTPLSTKFALAEAKLQDQNREKSEASEAILAIQTALRAGTKKLRLIYRYAVNALGKNHPLLPLFGFARQAPQTGGGQPDTPAPTYNEPNLMWAATANTTSYDVETSTDEGVTTNEVLSAENVLQVAVPRGAEEIWARVRSRNANGVSDWSAWVEIEALTLAPISGFGYVPLVGFGWNATTENIEFQASYDGGLTWVDIASGQYPSGTYPWIPPAGMFRIRRVVGGVAGPWTVITVTTP